MERFLWASNLANLANLKRYGNMNVHERCIISVCEQVLAYVLYNMSWRGLSVLLILGVRQCESLRPGMSAK